mmetsp:Transcript_10400/g.29766  ORF Transcript_10400/g.29766 Transcript_10400/m.29766 type:complete len:200 (-) Transcript_10400:599-1198(-)
MKSVITTIAQEHFIFTITAPAHFAFDFIQDQPLGWIQFWPSLRSLCIPCCSCFVFFVSYLRLSIRSLFFFFLLCFSSFDVFHLLVGNFFCFCFFFLLDVVIVNTGSRAVKTTVFIVNMVLLDVDVVVMSDILSTFKTIVEENLSRHNRGALLNVWRPLTGHFPILSFRSAFSALNCIGHTLDLLLYPNRFIRFFCKFYR